jgi:hypothetical protein
VASNATASTVPTVGSHHATPGAESDAVTALDAVPWEVAMALVAVCTTGTLTWQLSRHTDQPAGRSLRRVAGTLFAGAVVHLLAISPVGTVVVNSNLVVASATNLVAVLGFAVVSATAIFWSVFALEYTGRERLLTRPVAVALVSVPILTIVVAIVSLGFLDGTQPTLRVLVVVPYYISVTLLLAGTIVVVRPSIGPGSLPLGQGLGLAGAMVALYLGQRAGEFLHGPSLFALGLATAAGTLSYVLWRYRPFQTLPVARTVSRDRMIEEMSEAVLVVDADDEVRDLNESATNAFGVSRTDALGRPVERVAPQVATGKSTFQVGVDDRWLSVSTTDVTDERGRRLGRLLVCRDVTERRTREYRLQLLTRVLANTIRDRMRAVATDADALAADESLPGADRPADGGSAEAGTASDIRATATDLAALVARTRELEQALADGREGEQVDLARLLETVAADAGSEDRQTPSVSAPGDLPSVRFNERYLEVTFDALCESALERGGDVEIELTSPTDHAEVRIVDDGPAFDDSNPTDDPAIWLARTVTDTVGGALTVETTPDGGREVVVSLPERPNEVAPAPPGASS